MTSDKYDILGVPRSATTDEIRGAYLRLARTSHPDLNPGNAQAEADFKAIQLAYETLVDPVKRRDYDVGGSVKTVVYAQEFWHPPEFYWPEHESEEEFHLHRRSPLSFLQSATAAVLCLAILGSAGYGVYWMSNTTAEAAAVKRKRIIAAHMESKTQTQQQSTLRADESVDKDQPNENLLTDETPEMLAIASESNDPAISNDLTANTNPAYSLAIKDDAYSGNTLLSAEELEKIQELYLDDDDLSSGLDDIQLVWGSEPDAKSEFDATSEVAANYETAGIETDFGTWPNIGLQIPTTIDALPQSSLASPQSPSIYNPIPTSPPLTTQTLTQSTLATTPNPSTSFPPLPNVPSIATTTPLVNTDPATPFPKVPTPRIATDVASGPQLGVATMPRIPDTSLAPRMRKGHAELIGQSAEFFAPTPKSDFSSLSTQLPGNQFPNSFPSRFAGSPLTYSPPPNTMSTSLPETVLSHLLRSPNTAAPGTVKQTMPQLQTPTQRSGLLGTQGGYASPTNGTYSSPGMSIVPSTPTFPMPSFTPQFQPVN